MFAAVRSIRRGARGWRGLPAGLRVAPLSTATAPPGVTVVGSKADAERVIGIIRKLPKGTYHAWDTETTQIDLETQSPVGHGRVICASMYSGPDVDYGSGPRVWIPNLDAHDGILNEFKAVLESPSILKVWHNYGFDRHVLYNHGIDAQGLGGDTMHMARLWNTARFKGGGYSLEALSADLLDRKKTSIKDLFGQPKLRKDGQPGKEIIVPSLEDIQRDPLTLAKWVDYSTYDAEATWLLRAKLEGFLRARPWVTSPSSTGVAGVSGTGSDLTMFDFYQRYLLPFAECLTDMERAGITVDAREHLPKAEQLALADREQGERTFLEWAQRFCPDAALMNVGSDSQKAFLLFAPCERSSTRKKKKAAAGASGATAAATSAGAASPAPASAGGQPKSPAGVAAAAALIRTAQYVRTLSRPSAPAATAALGVSRAAATSASAVVDASAAPLPLAPGPGVDHDDDHDLAHFAADHFDGAHDHAVGVDAGGVDAVDDSALDHSGDVVKKRPRPRSHVDTSSAAASSSAPSRASSKDALGLSHDDAHTSAAPKRRAKPRTPAASITDDTLDGMAALGVVSQPPAAPTQTASRSRHVPSIVDAAGSHLGDGGDLLHALPPPSAPTSGTVIRRKPRAKTASAPDASEHPLLSGSIAGTQTAPMHATAPVADTATAEPAAPRASRARKAPSLTPIAAVDALGASTGVDVLAAAPPSASSLPRGSSITRRKVTTKLADSGAATTVVPLPVDGLQYPLAPGSGHSHRSLRTLNSSRLVWSMHGTGGAPCTPRQPAGIVSTLPAGGVSATAFVRPLFTPAAVARSPSTGSLRMQGLPSLRSAPQASGYALTLLPAAVNRNADGGAACSKASDAFAHGGPLVHAAAYHASPAFGAAARRFPAGGSAATTANKWSHIDASSCSSDSDASRQLFYSSSSESDAESVTWLLDPRGRPVNGARRGASSSVAGVASRAASAAASAAAGANGKATSYSSSSDDESLYGSDSDDAAALAGGSYYPPGASERLFFQDADAAATGLQAPARRASASPSGAGKRKASSGKPDPIALAQAAAAEAAKRQFDARAFVAALNAAPKPATPAQPAAPAPADGADGGDATAAKKPRKKKADGGAADAPAQALAGADSAAVEADDNDAAAPSKPVVDVPAMIIEAQKELGAGDAAAAGSNTLSEHPDDEDHWPAFRQYKIDNLDGYIEPGKKVAKKQRDITLVGLGMPPVALTDAGWPAVSSSVLRVLAGKVDVKPGKQPEYGRAYHYFGGGEEGRKACEALHALYTVSTIDTMLSNFIIPLQLMADAESRVHCSLNLNTETGRLSARRPSLQNQPALEKDRYGVRKAFRAPPGKKLLVADYGQLELRLLAHMAGCKSMIDAFAAGGDFHSRTAMGMYKHVAEAVSKGDVLLEWDDSQGDAPKPLLKNAFASERRKAKILNFSIAYGKTAIGLAKDWNVSLAEAKDTVEAWYSDRPEVREWQQRVLKEAKKDLCTRTLFGRYRDLPDIVSTTWQLRGHAERAAINTPIQGGAADVAMMAMLKVWRNPRLKELGWKMLLQIHDEIILEGPEESAAEALALLKADMELPFGKPLLVELVVDAKVADNWYEAK